MSVIATKRYATQTKATPSAREYTEVYQCETTTVADGPVQVRQALPALGASFSDDVFSVVVGYGQIRPSKFEEGHLTTWDATVNYSTVPNKNQGDCSTDLEAPPWEQPPRISGGGSEETVSVGGERDQANRRINNSAGWAFIDLFAPNSHPFIMMERDYLLSQFDLQKLWDSAFGVNLNPFWGLPAKQWRLDPPQWRLQSLGGNTNCQEYVTVLYTFRANYRGWDLRPRDEGDRDLNGNMLKIGADVIPGIHPLDGAGSFITAVADVTHFDGIGGNPAPFDWHPVVDFPVELGLPSGVP